MKILFVASGRSFHASRWANALSDKGIEVYYFATTDVIRPLSEKVVVYNGVGVKGKLSYLLNVSRLRTLIRKVEPDIVHAHYSSGNGMLAALANYNMNVPFITSLYGTEVFEFPSKSRFHHKILYSVAKAATKVLSTSEAMALEFHRLYPTLDKPTVTPFGVDTELFAPSDISCDDDSVTIGMVKKLEAKYGVDVFIQAAFKLNESLQAKGIMARFVVAGGGSQHNSLKHLVESLGLSDIFEFKGWVDNKDIPTILNGMDIFVVPSRCNESFGVAAVEAQSCGLPAVVSNKGGLPEVIEANVTGILVEPEDVEGLALALERLVLDKNLVREMGLKGRARVLERYDWNKSVDIVVEIYGEVLVKG